MLLQIENQLNKTITKLCRTFQENGFECYMVGGAVRDLLLKKTTHDIDFTTNAKPEEIQSIFPRTVATGLKHGTVTVLLNEQGFEVTTYRTEGDYSNARRPDQVHFTSNLHDDLSRRDFTINALAYDPLTDTLIDNHKGKEDLENKILRTVGDAKTRFFEDGLRPIRACRFRASLEFEFDSETKDALSNPEIHKRVALVARERFTDELFKGFCVPKVSRMIEALEKHNLLPIFTPPSQAHIHTHPQILKNLDLIYPAPRALRLAYWRFSLGLYNHEEIMLWKTGLSLSNKILKDIKNYIFYVTFQKDAKRFFTPTLSLEVSLEEKTKLPIWEELCTNDSLMYSLRCFLSNIKKEYEQESKDFIEGARNYIDNFISPENLIEKLQEYSLVIKDLKIDGNDLKKLGLSGKPLGICLTQLLAIVLKDQSKNTLDILMPLALEEIRKLNI